MLVIQCFTAQINTIEIYFDNNLNVCKYVSIEFYPDSCKPLGFKCILVSTLAVSHGLRLTDPKQDSTFPVSAILSFAFS